MEVMKNNATCSMIDSSVAAGRSRKRRCSSMTMGRNVDGTSRVATICADTAAISGPRRGEESTKPATNNNHHSSSGARSSSASNGAVAAAARNISMSRPPVYGLHTFGDPGCPPGGSYDAAFRDNVRVFLETAATREPVDAEGHPSWRIYLYPPDTSAAAHRSTANMNPFSNTMLHSPPHLPAPPANLVRRTSTTATSSLLPLFIVEEDIRTSRHPHCDHCRCIGWSHHLISNRQYHFIIPSSEIGDGPLGSATTRMKTDRSSCIAGAAASRRNGSSPLTASPNDMSWGMIKVCPSCHDPVVHPAETCSLCSLEPVPGSVLDLNTHLLHGVLHCNGFGHLLCVNGRENGSVYASGRELVDLWDRICAMLRARKVSVEDLGKKRSLELRLLHCVGYGQPWFGRWGYKFGHGSFGITQQMYGKAIEAIRGMPLSVLLQHFQGLDDDMILLSSIVWRYQGLASLGCRSAVQQIMPTAPASQPEMMALQTVGDLIRFMIELKARLPPCPSPSSSPPSFLLRPAMATISNNQRVNMAPFPKLVSLSSDQLEKKSNSLLSPHATSSGCCTASAATTTTTITSNPSSGTVQLAGDHQMPCRWSAKRLELATQVIVEALKSCEKKWMPRQDVRDAARVYIGDTGLLDFVLKSLGNKVVPGGHIVRRAVNPLTKVLEYSLEDVNTAMISSSSSSAATRSPDAPVAVRDHDNSSSHQYVMNMINLDADRGISYTVAAGGQLHSDRSTACNNSSSGSVRKAPTSVGPIEEVSRAEVMRDLLYLYKNVLESYKPAKLHEVEQGAGIGAAACRTVLSAIPTATRIILDTKQLMKDYCGETTRKCCTAATNGGDGDAIWGAMEDDEMIRVLCTLELEEDMLLLAMEEEEEEEEERFQLENSCSHVNGVISSLNMQGADDGHEVLGCHGILSGNALHEVYGQGMKLKDESKDHNTDHCESADQEKESFDKIESMFDEVFDVLNLSPAINAINSGSISSSLEDQYQTSGKVGANVMGSTTRSICKRRSGRGRRRPSPPPELVVLPPHATVGELKREAERAFRDTYFVLRGFTLESIPTLAGIADDDLLFGNIESGSHVVVRGRYMNCNTTKRSRITKSIIMGGNLGHDILDKLINDGVDGSVDNDDHGGDDDDVVMRCRGGFDDVFMHEMRFEGGSESWVVECPCGARDDDGERMIACDVCEVWQHTRCANIADSDPVPQRFLCNNCSVSFLKSMDALK